MHGKNSILEGEIAVSLGDEKGNGYKSCKLIGKTIRYTNEVLGSMPWEITCR